MPLRGLTIVVVDRSFARLHAALAIAAASAATGASTAVHLHAEAVALLAPPISAPEDQGYAAAGLPTLAEMLDRRPEEVIRLAVKGMLPRSRLGRAQLRKLKVYAGPEHPHAAQQPQPVTEIK